MPTTAPAPTSAGAAGKSIFDLDNVYHGSSSRLNSSRHIETTKTRDGSHDRSLNSEEMAEDVSLGRLYNPSLGHVLEGANQSYPRVRMLVQPPSAFDGVDEPSVLGEGTTVGRQYNEELNVTPWYRRVLTLVTMYGELSSARVSEDFVPLRVRLQQEWIFDAGFLVALSSANAAMFAITPDSIFEINSHAETAIATSSTACGLGIACDVWFLLRYNWVDLETFIRRSRDVYDSYAFFALSSRMPTVCMLLSTISLMTFLGLVAYDAWPVGVLIIVLLVILMMVLQFVVYGMHQFAASALRAWRAGVVSMITGFRDLTSG